MSEQAFDVAIIGLGPVGAALANFLGMAGLQVAVIEKEPSVYALPRAIHFDGEVMRVFQAIGLREQVEAISRPGLKGMHFVNAQGETLLVRGGVSADGPHGCANNHYFHQPQLEAVLRKGLTRFRNVRTYLATELELLTQSSDGVRLTLKPANGSDKGTIDARYVVGCDGARSMVRRVMGSHQQDLGLHQPWLVFDVLLTEEMPALPDYTVQHCDPARPMTYCNVYGNRRRWEIMLLPQDDPEDLVKPETLWRLVSRWISPSQAQIERAVIYTFHSAIAQTWRSGRLMLAGDAAHQTPPFLGQGLCAGMRDVSNLAWKLEAVVGARAHEDLLDTYQSERHPHVRAFIDLAVRLGDIIQTTDPKAAEARDAKFLAGEPEVFQFPSPRLGPSALQTGEGLAGAIFPQPRLDDGSLLDATSGYRFNLIARSGLLNLVPAEQLKLWRRKGIGVIDSHHRQLQAWLEEHAVGAILVRPDRYILGQAHTAEQTVMLCNTTLKTLSSN